MSFMRHLDRETQQKVRTAKKTAAKESKADRLARARVALQSAEKNARKPRERNGAFLSWLRAGRCLACAIRGGAQVQRTDAAHIRRSYPETGWRPVGGAEKPSDFRAIGLCRRDHEDQHLHDNHGWYADLGIYPPDVCAELMRAHLAGADPVEAVETIAAQIRAERSQA
jgi:hypothetical protein